MEASALPASVGLGRTRIAIGAPLLRIRSDEQLVTFFREGNDDAFRVIHDRYRARLCAYTRQMLAASGQDPEDAVQEIFMRAYYGLRANDRQLALRAWLYRIAHNRCIDELRRPQATAVDGIEELAPSVQDPVARAEQRDALRRLITDVQRLPDQQRSALLMRELSGMTYAEVSGALGVTVAAVKSLLVRARVSLAQASEARDTACAQIREDMILSVDRGVRTSGLARRHMRECSECRQFRSEVRGVNRNLAALAPTLGPLSVIANLLGFGGGGGAAAGGGAAGTGAAAGAAGTGAAASTGLLAGGATHVVTLLAAAVVTAGGAVELHNTLAAPAHHRVHHHAVATAPKRAPEVSAAPTGGVAVVAHSAPQVSSSAAVSGIGGGFASPAKTTSSSAASGAVPHATRTSATNQTNLTETLDPDNLIYAVNGLHGASDAAAGTAAGTSAASGTSAAGTGTSAAGTGMSAAGAGATSGPGTTATTGSGSAAAPGTTVTSGPAGTTTSPSSPTGTPSTTTPTSSVGSTSSPSSATSNAAVPAATSNGSSSASQNAGSANNTSGSSTSSSAASKPVGSSSSSTNVGKSLGSVTAKFQQRHRWYVVGRLL